MALFRSLALLGLPDAMRQENGEEPSLSPDKIKNRLAAKRKKISAVIADNVMDSEDPLGLSGNGQGAWLLINSIQAFRITLIEAESEGVELLINPLASIAANRMESLVRSVFESGYNAETYALESSRLPTGCLSMQADN
jgi:hypothetical protein